MQSDLLQDQRIDGFPLFACRDETARSGINWWSPPRSADATDDYAAGVQHFRTAANLSHALRFPDFYRLLMVPEIAHRHPAAFLANIVGDMRAVGAIERGFLDELAKSAVAGRVDPVIALDGCTAEDLEAQGFAIDMIELARWLGLSRAIAEELAATVDYSFNHGTAAAFVWTICIAAAAGAIH